MSLRLQRISRASNLCASSSSPLVQHASRAPDLHAVTSPRLHACSVPPELHTSMSPTRLYTASRAVYLYNSTSTRMQRTSSSRAPYPYASYTSLHSQHASRAPDLLRQTPPSLRACSASPELHTSMRPTRPHTRSAPPDLHTSMSLRLQRISRAPYLRLRRISRPPALHTSTPPRLHAYSAPPELPISTLLHLHVPTPAVRL